MDPIKEGKNIFRKLHEDIGKDQITDINEFNKFLKNLLKETKGLIIVDFLDAGNWDSIENFEIDYKNNLVYLNWHDYRNKKKSKLEKEMRSMFMPEDVCGLVLNF